MKIRQLIVRRIRVRSPAACPPALTDACVLFPGEVL